MPDPAGLRKPRRLGLIAPFALLAVFMAAWSFVWVSLRTEALKRLDAEAAALRAAGAEVAWREAKVGGWPFRLDVTLTDLRLRDPSGWGLAAPRLEAEAYAYNLDHWMAAADEGLTLVRPKGGPVEIRGRVIRASLRGPDQRPPAISIEGLDLSFQPGAGAAPFSLASADRAELHLRPGPDDQAAVLFKVERGRAAEGGTLQPLARNGAISLTWDAILSKVSGFSGASIAAAGPSWSRAGGALQVRQAELKAGGVALVAQPGRLTIRPDGRLTGALAVGVTAGPEALDALAASGRIRPEAARAGGAVLAAAPQVPIAFSNGRTMIGPVPVAPAPRLW